MTDFLSTQHRVLQFDAVGADPQLKMVPIPQPGPGSAIIRIEVAEILSYHRDIYNGSRHYSFPTPLVGGMNAIGRITAVGPDATVLQEGQLVYIDCVIHARDNADTLFLSAIHDSGSEGSKRLMRNVWRDGCFAEYAKFPLENCFVLNEMILCRTLGYSIQDLMYIAHLLVPFGGLRDIRLEAGETIVVSPATGGYGGAGVMVAIAMGARVIAMGRNDEELARLKTFVLAGSPGACIETLKITGEEAADSKTLEGFGVIDAVLDLSPPQASKSTHVRSATSILRRNGRASLMGFVEQAVVPWHLVGRNITLKGKLMYDRDDILLLIKMLERGLFPRGRDFVDTKAFVLENWKVGLDIASKHTGVGKQVVFTP